MRSSYEELRPYASQLMRDQCDCDAVYRRHRTFTDSRFVREVFGDATAARRILDDTQARPGAALTERSASRSSVDSLGNGTSDSSSFLP